ncbi:MAG: RHS repeat protein [Proteobacteria bacterium]|nr:RHS repeat protein [Pseudomonadota bacterium]
MRARATRRGDNLKAKSDRVSTSRLRWSRWLTVVLTSVIAAGALASTVTYTYDELGRLTTVLYDDGTTTNYALDAAGNRTAVTTSTSGGGAATVHFGAATYTIDEDIGIFL